MFGKNTIEEAKEKSMELLRKISTEKGFVASAEDKDNYKRVWGRDGVIAGLAALKTKESDLIQTFKFTLETLKRHQDKTGRIPSNVSLDETSISYGTTVGRIDSTIWYLIGISKFIKEVSPESRLDFEESAKKALFYLECLELNGRGLIYVPAGGDWADEYVNEGYVLFDQALYAIALKLYSEVFDSKEVKEKYNTLLEIIDVNYFPVLENSENNHVYNGNIFKKACERYEPPLPITSFSPFDINHIHDLFALSLVFDLGITDSKENRIIEDFIGTRKRNGFAILPAFSPVIDENHDKWNALRQNHLFEFKNKPHEFHNGGLWPMVYGFYLASKQNISKKELKEFAEVLKRDNYIFPEFYNGETFEPKGTINLGFSASGYLLAYYKFKNGSKIF